MRRGLAAIALPVWFLVLVPLAGAQQKWLLVDQVDVGDSTSEKEHSYRIGGETWRGPRTLSYPDGRRVYDDGRAHQGSEVFVVTGLNPNRPLKLVKRVDFTVADQTTDLYVDGKYVGRWKVAGSSSGWSDAEFVIPGRFITRSTAQIEQRFISSAIDATSFYYWAYQEPAPARGGILGEILGGLGREETPQERRYGIDPEEQALLDAMKRYIDSQQALLDALRRYFESR